MAHFTFSELKDCIQSDVDTLNNISDRLQKCESPEKATRIADELDSLIDSLRDIQEQLREHITRTKQPPVAYMPRKYSPVWCLSKPFDDGSILSIRLDDGAIYFESYCPQCDKVVTTSQEEFAALIADYGTDVLQTSVWCDECHQKSKANMESTLSQENIRSSQVFHAVRRSMSEEGM